MEIRAFHTAVIADGGGGGGGVVIVVAAVVAAVVGGGDIVVAAVVTDVVNSIAVDVVLVFVVVTRITADVATISRRAQTFHTRTHKNTDGSPPAPLLYRRRISSKIDGSRRKRRRTHT